MGYRTYSPKYHSFILRALDYYKTNRIIHADMKLADQFVDEMLTSIINIRETYYHNDRYI